MCSDACENIIVIVQVAVLSISRLSAVASRVRARSALHTLTLSAVVARRGFGGRCGRWSGC